MSNTGVYILLFLVGFLTAKAALPAFLRVLAAGDGRKKNWRGQEIPAMAGIIFPLLVSLNTVIYGLFAELTQRAWVFILSIALITWLGLYDDLYGDNGPKGLKGHLLSFIQKGMVTTGFIKAAGTAAVAAWAVISLGYTFLEWLLVVLAVNTVNLLDLRPGRAVKGSALFLAAALLCAAEDYWLIMIVGGLLAAYAPHDLRAEAMLGDCGSNTLGMMAGLSLLSAPGYFKAGLIIVLAAFHLLAEKYSFSAIIEKNNVLSRLDRWGRRGERNADD